MTTCVHQSCPVDVAADNPVMSIRHEETECKAAKHHFDGGLPLALVGLHSDHLGGKRQLLFRQPEVFAKPPPQFRKRLGQVALSLRECLQFTFILSQSTGDLTSLDNLFVSPAFAIGDLLTECFEQGWELPVDRGKPGSVGRSFCQARRTECFVVATVHLLLCRCLLFVGVE